jgi:hypothetical protein
MNIALVTALASIGGLLAGLTPEVLIPSIFVTLTITVAINVTINK